MRSLTTTLLLCFSIAVAFANGDPVAVTSAITLSSSPVAVHVPEVQMLNEQVLFVPNGKYTEVTVRYLLHNQSKKDFKALPYGFPIDYNGTGESQWGWLNDFSESRQMVGWRDDYVQNVTFSLDGRPLPWQCSKDTIIKPAGKTLAFDVRVDLEPDSADGYSQKLIQKLYKEYGEDIYSYTHPISRRWFYTYLDIPAGQLVMLEVHYKVEHFYQEGLYNHSEYFENYEENYYCDGSFSYDFAPAAYWGNGKAQRFIAELNASHIKILSDEYYFRGLDRKHSGIQGLNMKKVTKDLWRYEATDFDFASAKPFAVDFESRQVTQPVAKILNNRISPKRYTVTVSGVDPKYPAKNLSDGDLSTTMVLRPDSAGKYYITIQLKDTNIIPEGVILYNGYCKNRELWHNNSRIGTLLVTEDVTVPEFNLYYKKWFPKDNTYALYYDFRKSAGIDKKEYAPLKVPGEPLAFDWQNLTDNAVVIKTGYGDYWERYEGYRLHFAIDKIVPGAKYEDLCVSEIILVGREKTIDR
ncbi:MAG: hypothetical protein K6F40_07235 [Bacteroidales bacterium]|nr:hypothetical protein [Bacteroidales bacterium]